jgi:hypothetical protein
MPLLFVDGLCEAGGSLVPIADTSFWLANTVVPVRGTLDLLDAFVAPTVVRSCWTSVSSLFAGRGWDLRKSANKFDTDLFVSNPALLVCGRNVVGSKLPPPAASCVRKPPLPT